MTMYQKNQDQSLLFDVSPLEEVEAKDSTTFTDNMRLPVHRWFRFSAGYSAQWVEKVIREWNDEGDVFDPFTGSGTTLIAALAAGRSVRGIEAHPFIYRVASAKLKYNASIDDFRQRADQIIQKASTLQGQVKAYSPIIRKCYSDQALSSLDRLRQSWESMADGTDASELTWLLLVAILRQVSHVGTAPWQYILPRKSKRIVMEPIAAYERMKRQMIEDMQRTNNPVGVSASLLHSDARTCAGVPDGTIGLVVTSPPYANNYDYADSTRLEMSFIGEIKEWGDLQTVIRRHLVRSCTQHVPEREVNLEAILASPELSPIQADLRKACLKLAIERRHHGGKKTYHLMAACYFHDLARVWISLRRVCRPGAQVCFVIGDSAPYGVPLAVMDWLGELALAAGFRKWRYEKTRDRNIKWKNRKHRVPLSEGRLWVEG